MASATITITENLDDTVSVEADYGDVKVEDFTFNSELPPYLMLTALLLQFVDEHVEAAEVPMEVRKGQTI